jgi:hypothetical protein
MLPSFLLQRTVDTSWTHVGVCTPVGSQLLLLPLLLLLLLLLSLLPLLLLPLLLPLLLLLLLSLTTTMGGRVREEEEIPWSGTKDSHREGAGNREVHAEREQEEETGLLPALPFYAPYVTTLPPIGSSSSSSLGNGWAPLVLGGSALAARGVRVRTEDRKGPDRYRDTRILTLVRFERHSRDEGRAGHRSGVIFSGIGLLEPTMTSMGVIE